MLILDCGAITRLAKRTRQNAATITVLRREGLWPPIVLSVVVVEATSGRPRVDANTNRLLETCDIGTDLHETVARRAARLRFQARKGSAVDAVLVAVAEPGGAVLTGDPDDLRTLAGHANNVIIETI